MFYGSSKRGVTQKTRKPMPTVKEMRDIRPSKDKIIQKMGRKLEPRSGVM